MNMLSALLARSRPKRTADAVIARRIESERAKMAHARRKEEQRRIIRDKAASLGRVTEPMTPREVIAQQVAAERAARKHIPVPGGAERGAIGNNAAERVEDSRGENCYSRGGNAPALAATRTIESPSAGLFGESL